MPYTDELVNGLQRPLSAKQRVQQMAAWRGRGRVDAEHQLAHHTGFILSATEARILALPNGAQALAEYRLGFALRLQQEELAHASVL